MLVKPNFLLEQAYWQQGIRSLAGVDEAGMGAWAGPVVAAAVIFWPGTIIPEDVPLRDSKKLSAKQRESLVDWIKEKAATTSVGLADVKEIDRLNIRAASHLAIQRAVTKLDKSCELILLDGNPAQPHPTIPAVNVVNGDALSCSIAAASVLAKVHRDQILVRLDRKLGEYGFAKHKGYGTAEHKAALSKLGVSNQHRKSYKPIAALV